MASIIISKRHSGTKRLVMAAGGAAAALALTAGVVGWQRGAHEDAPAAAGVAVQPNTTTIQPVRTDTTTGSTGAHAQSGAISTSAPRLSVYITGSDDEAQYLRRFTYEIGELQAAAGQQRDQSMVVSVPAGDGVVNLSSLLATVGNLPGSHIYDLRVQ